MPGQRRGGGDHLKEKTAEQSQFETEFAAGAGRHVPVKLGAKEYDRDMWDSPMMRTLKRAVAGWEVPAPNAGLQLQKVLKDSDPNLAETSGRPGREAWRAALQQHLVAVGLVQRKPTAYFLAGPLGAGTLALAQRLWAEGVFPSQAVRAEAEFLHALVPEHSELLAQGDARAAEVVHEEASIIARAAFSQAVAEKRDLVHGTMFRGPAQLERLQQAKAAGFRRLVVAVAAPLDVARANAGAGGAAFSEALLVDSHRDFVRSFDGVVKGADELVLLLNDGKRMLVAAKGKAGELQVRDDKLFPLFLAMKA